jgi:hypothetical protein
MNYGKLKMSKLLTKDQILAFDDIEVEEIEVWGGTVRIHSMSGTARDRYEQHILATRSKDANENMANIRATLLAHTIVDEEGNLVFGVDDIKALGLKSIKGIQKAFNVASRLNALDSSDVEKLAGN